MFRIIFHFKSSKSSVYYTLTAYLLYQPQAKHSPATSGSQLPYWTTQVYSLCLLPIQCFVEPSRKKC